MAFAQPTLRRNSFTPRRSFSLESFFLLLFYLEGFLIFTGEWLGKGTEVRVVIVALDEKNGWHSYQASGGKNVTSSNRPDG